MINSEFIIRKIDNTCNLLNGKDNLKDLGFNKIIGYSQIVNEINLMDIKKVFIIIKILKDKKGIYEEFIEHLLISGELSESFFQIDDNFNETENNLNFLLNKENNDNNEFLEITSLENKILEQNENFEQLFSKKEEDINVNLDFKKLNDNDKIENKLDKIILNWIKNDVPKLNNKDFGNLMTFIMKNKMKNL